MNYSEIYESWLGDARLNAEAKNELENLKDNKEEIEYRFGAELEFGTAGMRGIIGYGTNMMNVYTVKRATQGLAEFIKTLPAETNATSRGVVISYDTRLKSDEFARAAADVLAANGICAYIFGDVHPVPMLSFAVRNLNTVAGIMITASHNPKQYNGYKVYGEDGAQMSPEDTDVVVGFIKKIDDYLGIPAPTEEQTKKYIKTVPSKVDKKYYKELKKLTLSKKAVKACGKDLKLVYTPVHGSGYIPVTTILKKIGINATVVEEQTKKDTDFSTVEVPNPEFKETLSMGIALANKIGATVVFGTDPDSDRLGVAVKNGEGEFEALSGNQVGILLLDYILTRLKEENALPANAAVVKSFVTTGMAKAICKQFGVELFEVPVGFKFIGEKIKLWEKDRSHTYIFGFEESCGYLRGTHARDKDAVVATMLVAEMAAAYLAEGKTLEDVLDGIYSEYGRYFHRTVSFTYEGVAGAQKMKDVLAGVRKNPPRDIDGSAVVQSIDYMTQTQFDLPKSDVLSFKASDGSKLIIRPSGTEPLIKVYITAATGGEARIDSILEQAQKFMA